MEQEFAIVQRKLAKKINIPINQGYFPEPGDHILSLDIQYVEDQAFIGGDLLIWDSERRFIFAGETICKVPYVPGFFCFREGPPLFDFVSHLLKIHHAQVDLIIVDGHGIAHPRSFGIACWLGLAFERPCIGFAKKSLLPYDQEPEDAVGSTGVIVEPKSQQPVGYTLRTQQGIKPVFVSPGHLISLESCKEVILALTGKYRIPENIRIADQTARAYSRGENGQFIDLGLIPEYEIPI